jgi:2-polyprenyl-3-methyl-5-hydroxy-6-metoxy-1,4-benzoquinol methylase
VNNLSYFNEYYEQPSLWGNELTSLERERIQKTIEFIPEDVKSILDIGCGDGNFSS